MAMERELQVDVEGASCLATSQDGVFHGFILYKEPQVPDSKHSYSLQHDCTKKKKKKMVLKSEPNKKGPGIIEILDSTENNTIQFFSDKRVLVATEREVSIDVPYGRDRTNQFHIEPNNANGANAGIMVNEDQLCVCLNIEGEPKLVPVSKGEATSAPNIIFPYITVFQDTTSTLLDGNIALFFRYCKPDKKIYNCYLMPTTPASPTEASCQISLKEVENSGDEIDHKQYCCFTTCYIYPGGFDSTDEGIDAGSNTEPTNNCKTSSQ